MNRRLLLLLPFFSFFIGCRSPATQISNAEAKTSHLAPGYIVPRTVAPLFNPALSPLLLDDTKRNHWQKPNEIIALLNIKSEDHIADIGAGSGYLMPFFLKKLGPKGHLYEEEVQESYITLLKKRTNNNPQVSVVIGTESDPLLPFHAIDIFVLLTTYHEVQRPVFFLQTLKRYAKPHARLVVIDFDTTLKGKTYSAPTDHSVMATGVLQEAEAAGWKFTQEKDFLNDSSQFVLIFTLP